MASVSVVPGPSIRQARITSQMLAFTAERFGFPAITRALALWGQGKATKDVIAEAFGVAPAVLFYQSGLRELGATGTSLCLIYLLCVAFRLARFSISAGE